MNTGNALAQVFGDAVDVEPHDCCFAFFREEEGFLLESVHKEVFREHRR